MFPNKKVPFLVVIDFNDINKLHRFSGIDILIQSLFGAWGRFYQLGKSNNELKSEMFSHGVRSPLDVRF